MFQRLVNLSKFLIFVSFSLIPLVADESKVGLLAGHKSGKLFSYFGGKVSDLKVVWAVNEISLQKLW